MEAHWFICYDDALKPADDVLYNVGLSGLDLSFQFATLYAGILGEAKFWDKLFTVQIAFDYYKNYKHVGFHYPNLAVIVHYTDSSGTTQKVQP